METKKRISAAGFDIDSPEVKNGKKESLELIRKEYYEYKKKEGYYRHFRTIMFSFLFLTAYSIFYFGFNCWEYYIIHSILFAGFVVFFFITGNKYGDKQISKISFGFFLFNFITGFMDAENDNNKDEMLKIIQEFENKRHWYQEIL